MALLARKAKILAFSRFSKPIQTMDEVIEHHYRVGLSDLDENRHMNNARYLPYMELGRWEIMVRTGFLKFATKAKVMAPVIAQNVVYRRPLAYRARFTIRSRFLFWNERGALFEHQVLNSVGELSAMGLVECRVLSKDKSLDLAEIARRLGVEPGTSFRAEHTIVSQAADLSKALLALSKTAKGSPSS